jgi:hypothetical protein
MIISGNKMKNFDDFLENKGLDEETQGLADLIIETGFPIKEFVQWYAEIGISLREEIVMEGFWGQVQQIGAGLKAGVSGWSNDWKVNYKLGQLNNQRQNVLRELGTLKNLADDPAFNNFRRISDPMKGYRGIVNGIVKTLSKDVQKPVMRQTQPQQTPQQAQQQQFAQQQAQTQAQTGQGGWGRR